MIEQLFTALLDWVAAHPHWTGLLIFFTALAESLAVVGMLVPGAAMMFGFGALIALGKLSFWSACAWAVAGAVVGDGLSYWLGRAFHEQLRGLWPFSRHPLMLARAEVFFQHHGGKSVLFGRFFGPVRAVIPAVAGMMDMPAGRFFAVNVASALLWAPAYLLPGMVFAASLELAAQVAWRLVVLMLLLIVLVWLTVRVVRIVSRLLQPRVHAWVRTAGRWCRGRPVLGTLSHALLDPEGDEVRGLALLAVLLLCSGLLLGLVWQAAGQDLPTALDQSLYRFLQDLRTPWNDALMVLITEVGDSEVKLALTVGVAGYLLWRGARSALYHWLAALSFGVVSNSLFKALFQVARPVEAYQGMVSSWSFPSNHATMGTILFGFLAVLLARDTRPSRRWVPYLAAALLIVPVSFSRLYLGVHWLSDTLAGMALGLVWVSLLGLAYNRHPARRVGRRGLILTAGAALLLALLPHAWLHHAQDMERYRLQPEIRTMSADQWLEGGWRTLPGWRLDFQGRRRQGLDLQWAGRAAEIRQTLQNMGWQEAIELTPATALRWLNPGVSLEDLPVLPQVHAGLHDPLTMVYHPSGGQSRYVLRFWDSGVRLPDGRLLWLGGLSRQHLDRRLGLAWLEVDHAPAEPLPEAADPTGLEGISVAPAGHSIRLIPAPDSP